MSARGRWFTDTLDEAQQRAAAQGGHVLFVDVPAAFYERWVYYDAKECNTQGPSSFILSSLVRRTARVLTGNETAPKPGQLRLYRGTGPDEPEDGR